MAQRGIGGVGKGGNELLEPGGCGFELLEMDRRIRVAQSMVGNNAQSAGDRTMKFSERGFVHSAWMRLELPFGKEITMQYCLDWRMGLKMWLPMRTEKRFFRSETGELFRARVFRFRSCLSAIVMAAGLAGQPAKSAEVDFRLPEEFQSPMAARLEPENEARVEVQSRFMESIVVEEERGPDEAFVAKRRVLDLEPGVQPVALSVARDYLSRNQVPEAVAVLKDCVRANPKATPAAMMLAAIYLHTLDKKPLAERYAWQVLRTVPGAVEALEILREALLGTGQSRRWESAFAEASRLESLTAERLLDLAELRLRDLNRKNAPKNASADVVDLLERALRMKEGNGRILERCADLFLATGETSRASNCLRDALQSGSAGPLAKEKLAECEWLQRNDDEAARLLEEVLAGDPLRLPAYDRLAGIRLRQDNPKAALTALQQALVLAPVDPRRHEDVIRVALRAHDYRAALDLAADARKRFPYLMEFAVLQAVALSEAGRHGEALMTFDRTRIEALHQDPRILDATFFAAYGAAAERAGHYEKAAELLKTAIGLDPGNAADSKNHLAYMWAELGIHLEEAEKLSRASLAAEPDNGAYLDTLGWILHRQGAHDEALTHLRRAAERLPDPVVLDHLGDVLNHLGKRPEAVAAWRKALEKNPGADAIAAKIQAGGELTRGAPPEDR